MVEWITIVQFTILWGFDLTEGTYTGVTWTSRDGSSPEYHHVGRLIITDIDPSRPNHS